MSVTRRASTMALSPTEEEIETMMAVSPKYGIEIRLPGHG